MVIMLFNVPADAGVDELRDFLAGHGMSDASDLELVPGDGSQPAATFRLPVSASVAETVAEHLRGKVWREHVLDAQALLMTSH